MTKTMHGKVHGRTIELDEDLGVAEGQEVEIQVRLLFKTGRKPGEGFLRTEGTLAGDTSGMKSWRRFTKPGSGIDGPRFLIWGIHELFLGHGHLLGPHALLDATCVIRLQPVSPRPGIPQVDFPRERPTRRYQDLISCVKGNVRARLLNVSNSWPVVRSHNLTLPMASADANLASLCEKVTWFTTAA